MVKVYEVRVEVIVGSWKRNSKVYLSHRVEDFSHKPERNPSRCHKGTPDHEAILACHLAVGTH